MEPFSREAARARRKGAFFYGRPRSRAKLIGAVAMRKRWIGFCEHDEIHRIEDNAIHLAPDLRDITVRQQ